MKNIYLCLLFIYFTLPSIGQQLRISEVQSSNSTVLQDEDGDFSDWIELVNSGESSVNLSNYFISDDEISSSQWQFPSYSLKAGETIVIFASGKDRKVAPSHWNPIIEMGDEWKYIVPEDNIANWNSLTYDDTTWLNGKSGFGYADNDDSTIVEKTISIYLRNEFTIDAPSEITQLLLHMDYDDGFVAYINGVEIARANLGTIGQPVNFDDLATIDHEAGMYQGLAPDSFNIENFSELLKVGTNLLAIEVHNNWAESSDLTAIPFLSAQSATYTDQQTLPILGLQSLTSHTNFKLSAEGDSLFLFDTNAKKIDELIVPALRIDHTAGFKPNDYSQLYFFQTPTPWLPNTSTAFLNEETVLPQFSVAGGIYDQSVELVLSTANPADTIYYTTDGSDPDTLSLFYFAPIHLDNPTTVKARIIKNGYLPGTIVTQSYFPSYNKALPVVFISTTPDNLWDYYSGIYTTGPNAASNFPYRGANFWMDWEKAVHAELYFPSNKEGFSMNGGLKIFGNYSRGYDQKSMAFYARSKYGDGDIDCKIFDQKPIDSFESIVFRSGGTDSFGEVQSWGTIVRDLILTQIGIDLDLDAQAAQPCVIYLNGDYWGIYNIREKVNEHFIADNNGIDEDNIDILEYDSLVVAGSNENYLNMLEFIQNNSLATTANYDYIKTQMDIDNFIRYNIIEQYAHNTDWPGNNIKYWREQSETGKWRWILYDVDATFGIWFFDEELHTNSIALALDPDNDDWPNPAWSTLILRSLMTNQGFKERFINTFADHLNTTLLPDSMKNRIVASVQTIEDEIEYHTEKWGSFPEKWQFNISRLKTFAEKRPSILRKFILEQFSLADSLNVQLATSGCEGANIQLNTILLDQFPWTGIYFEEVPIELTAIAPIGYKFARWEGDFQSTEAQISVPMDKAYSLTAVFEEDESSKNMQITEIMYHPSNEFDSDDWVELYNNSPNYVNLSNWILKDSDDLNQYKFQTNTILGPHEYLVVCRNTANFNLIYPDVENYQGSLGFGFSSNGECIRLYNSKSELIDQVCYSSESPWPTEADGLGYSLILKDLNADNSLAQNWSISSTILGSPGNENVTTSGSTPIENNSYIVRNYPNPSDWSTTIEVYNSLKQNVTITIFNLQGQLETVLFSGILDEGTQQFEWTTTQKPSGIYLVRMSTPSERSYLKIVIQH
ncbi:CotH kinase family protein [Mangrovibacterium sp.]|uniref:CotH kinase family protein n=1 Tax=Mangrovibacterium sp. TaxID=1961364 RepID=UPI00356AD8DE